jgi:hypothetical protein
MAAATSVRHKRGPEQFQGVFSEVWTVNATWDPASAAAGAQTTSDTITVPGVAVGDMVLGLSLSTEVAASPIIRGRVTAADTVVLAIISGTGVTADMASGSLKMVIGRPVF